MTLKRKNNHSNEITHQCIQIRQTLGITQDFRAILSNLKIQYMADCSHLVFDP